MSDKIIDFFSWYVLHDIPVKSMEFDFINSSIQIFLDEYDDLTKNDIVLNLSFKRIKKFTINYPLENYEFKVCDIYGAKLKKIAEENYELTLILTMVHKIHKGEYDVCEMLIGFEDLEIIDGLSREAMAYKWQNED